MAWVITFLIAILLITGASKLFRSSERRDYCETPAIGSVPEFRFTTQDGKELTREDLLGKVWVIDFFFSRCPGPCPMMNSKLAEISKELKEAKEVRLVSLSIDPEYDTPAVLKEYAGKFGADPDRWIFLTGTKEKVEAFTTKGMLQALSTDSSTPANTVHSTRFLVIDREGRIRIIRKLDEPELVQKLLIDIGNLLREPYTKPKAP